MGKAQEKLMIWSILNNHTVKTARRLLDYRHLLTPLGRTPEKKFVILMHPRSGSTLLLDLLSQHPDIRCDGEILGSRVPFPQLFIEARSRKARKPIYGFKMTNWQIISKQKLASNKPFMRGLHDQGWHIIYLKRNNILRQAISLLVIEHKRARGYKMKGFHHRASKGPVPLEKIHIDCDHLLKRMGEREGEMRGVKGDLESLPHLTLVYEDNLLKPEDHQRTADLVFDYLGVKRIKVTAGFVKTSKDRLPEMIENYDEMACVLANTKYANLLTSS